MTPNNFSNISVATTLVAGIGAGDLSMTVADATGYPAVPFAVVIDVGSVTSEEAVLVTAKAGTLWTISRAYDGTSAHVHSAGASVRHAALARDFRGLILGTREMSTALPANGDAVVWNTGAAVWEPVAIATQAELDAAIADLVNDYARLHFPNTFTQSQTIQGHSAIGSDATPDHYYIPDGSNWTELLYLSDTPLTDMSDSNGYGYWSIIGAYQEFNPSSIVELAIFLLGVEGHTQGSQDYISANAIYGVFRHEGSGLMPYIDGLEYGVYNSADGDVGTALGISVYVFNDGSGTMDDAAGIRTIVQNRGVGTTNSAIGVDVGDVTGATLNYAIRTGVGPVRFGDYLESPEIIAPLAPPANTGRTFYRDNGAGKTQYCVRFPTGAIQVLAVEP